MEPQVQFGNVTIDPADRRLDYESSAELQFALLKAFIADTYASNKYHRARMTRAKVTPDDIRTPDDLVRVPVLSPDDVASIAETELLPDYLAKAARTNMKSLPAPERIWRRFASTGTTGRPKVSYFTQTDWLVALAASGRPPKSVDPTQTDWRLFNAFYAGHVGGKLTEDSHATDGYVVVNRHFSTACDEALLDQLYRGIPELGGFNVLAIPPLLPPALAAKGGTLDSLLKIDAENYIGKNIRHILTGGFPVDYPGYSIRERIWEANELAGKPKALITEFYGASEVLPIALSCERYTGLHLHPGHQYTQVIDEKTGRHVENGGHGLVITTGIRHASRFLRYALGDEATYVNEPCPCGRVTPRLLNVARVLDKERITQGCAAGGLG
jgi:phenylacetate-CoA ligase